MSFLQQNKNSEPYPLKKKITFWWRIPKQIFWILKQSNSMKTSTITANWTVNIHLHIYSSAYKEKPTLLKDVIYVDELH